MPLQYYLPRTLAELAIWFANWAAKLQVYGTGLGASAAEKAQATLDATNVLVIANSLAGYRTFLQNWTEFKDLMIFAPIGTGVPVVPTPPAAPIFGIGTLAAIVARTQLLNERLRSSGGYTVAIGEDLGIVGPAVVELTKPENVTAKAQPGSDVRIGYQKGGFAGVAIYRKRGNETQFTLLAIDTNTPYMDTSEPLVAGQPETRTYRLRLYDGDAETGDYSDEVSVVTVP